MMRGVFREDHNMFREMARRFVDREIVPNLHEWEKNGIVPKEVWLKAGELGLLCSTVPEEYGGSGGDFGHSAVMIEELARANATAVGFTTHSEIVAPYIVAYGSEEQKQKWLPRMVSGELIGVIAMSEPGIGSDLRSMRTLARRDGDDYIVSGQKTFITNGSNAGLIVTATKLVWKALSGWSKPWPRFCKMETSGLPTSAAHRRQPKWLTRSPKRFPFPLTFDFSKTNHSLPSKLSRRFQSQVNRCEALSS